MRLSPRLLLALPAILAFAAPAPVLAQPGGSLLQFVALATNGLRDGAHLFMGSLRNATVAATGEGAYRVTFTETGKFADFLFRQEAPCVYTLTTDYEGDTSVPVRYNFMLATGISYYDQGIFEGLNAVLVTIEGPPEVMQGYANDMWQNQPVAVASLLGSATVDELKVAGDVIMKVCGPKTAGQ